MGPTRQSWLQTDTPSRKVPVRVPAPNWPWRLRHSIISNRPPPTAAAMPPPWSDRFSTFARPYDVALCDVWGVIHNGVAAFPDACEALKNFRASGGTVMLITNAPRPGEVVMRFLDKLAVPRDTYDGVVSSGDVTRGYVAEHVQQRIFRLGPERDAPIYAGLDVHFAPVETADYVVCTGLFDDETETPEDYRPLLAQMRARSLFMVCANPDVV